MYENSKTVSDETKSYNAQKTVIHKIMCIDIYFNYTKFVEVC